jgi:hypothetical protein
MRRSVPGSIVRGGFDSDVPQRKEGKMRRFRIRLGRLLGCALVASLGVWALASEAMGADSAHPVCNAYHDAIAPGSGSAGGTTFGGCYPSDSAARTAARRADRRDRARTGRRTKWVVIGLDCDAGLSEVCTVTDKLWHWGKAGPCDSDTSYSSAYIGDQWNDRPSGARGYHGCNRFIHFKDSGFGGEWLSCGLKDPFTNPPPSAANMACVSLDGLSDETSSEEWHHCGNPNRLCFRGR